MPPFGQEARSPTQPTQYILTNSISEQISTMIRGSISRWSLRQSRVASLISSRTIITTTPNAIHTQQLRHPNASTPTTSYPSSYHRAAALSRPYSTAVTTALQQLAAALPEVRSAESLRLSGHGDRCVTELLRARDVMKAAVGPSNILTVAASIRYAYI